MDFLHRRPQERDTRTGHDCEFCAQLDPNFNKRRPIDKLVHNNLYATASGHLTEDGYVKHRMLEISSRIGMIIPPSKTTAA
jgi:hypothetical protein